MAGNMKDFATGIVATAPSPATTGTSLVLQSGEGARMPATPFYAVAHPATEMPTLDNAEKIQVTNITSNTLTIVRAQGDTTAKSIDIGWRISNTLFKADLTETDPVFNASEAKNFVAGDASKLSGIEANADVTDATNVAAAGAIMDGDFSTNGLMKRTGAGTYATATSTDYVNGFADPNADRIVFWDDSVGAYAALTASTGLTLSGTNLTVRSASSTATGIAELATDAETVTGTDTGRVTTPANLTAKMAAPGNIGGTTPGTGTFTTATATTVVAHTISEKNFGNGVTIDGALIKDGAVTNPAASAPAAPAEGMLWWDTDDTSNPGGDLATDHISEVTSGHGVAVDGLTIKDGLFVNPYKFRAYKSANSNLTGTAIDTIVFDTESYDSGSNYNNSTGTFTAPIAGYYQFTAHVRIDSTAATYIQIYVAGEKCNDAATSNGQQRNLFGSVTVYLASGGTATVRIYHDGNCTVMGSTSECVFSGSLISV